MSIACVVTTIQSPTDCIHELARRLGELSAPLYIVGDKKGPAAFDVPGARFYSINRQETLSYALARLLPVGHYTRKNLGYLLAIADGASCIYETDDDNMPNAHWSPREVVAEAQMMSPRSWANVYRVFSDDLIWPRGFPLDRITDEATFEHDAQAPSVSLRAPIQQGLADLSPDVDAVWRLLNTNEFYFRRGASLALPEGTWCPFNSQTTWWWPEAYALMYLPSHCSFRMTDIWRSFIAQRCLWAMGHSLVFHAPEAIQERNEHRLIADFRDEVPGYLQNDTIVEELGRLELASGTEAVAGNLVRCYERLIECEIFPPEELPLVRGWCEDLMAIERPGALERAA